MILKQPLTTEQRRVSQLNYNRYCLINGASYMCLGETVIVLLANKLQAPNAVVAILGAMMYLGYLLLPVGVKHAGRVGAARSQADFWVCRNISALLVASSAFATALSQHLSWGIVMLGSFLFYGFRAAGLVMAEPLIGDFTTNEDRARLLGESNARFYLAAVCSLLAVSFLLNWNDHLWVLVGIIAAGACMGVTSSSFLRRIDETENIRNSAQEPLLPQLCISLKDKNLWQQIHAGVMFNLANIMLMSISVLMLKRGYRISDTQAIVFSTIQFAAAIVGAKLIAPIAKKVGARKLAMVAYAVAFPICLSWVLMPATLESWTVRWLLGVPFLLLGLFSVLNNNAMTFYFLQSIPKERQVPSSMFIYVVKGVGASLIGMLIASSLLKLCESYFGQGIAMFKIYFTSSAVVLLAGLATIWRLKDLPPTNP